jgi:hypothetical protein
MVVTLLALGRTLPDWGGAFPMWSSVTADLAERLVPDGGKGLLGEAKYCRECEGRGYTRKSQNVWQACPNCYAGRCWITKSTTTDAPAES